MRRLSFMLAVFVFAVVGCGGGSVKSVDQIRFQHDRLIPPPGWSADWGKAETSGTDTGGGGPASYVTFTTDATWSTVADQNRVISEWQAAVVAAGYPEFREITPTTGQSDRERRDVLYIRGMGHHPDLDKVGSIMYFTFTPDHTMRVSVNNQSSGGGISFGA